MNNENKKESSIVRAFINHLREKDSFLLDANENPDYVINYKTHKIYKDLNMILLGQAKKDKKVDTALVLTKSQLKNNGAYVKDGEVPLCTALYDKFSSYYKKEDKEVYGGLNEEGELKKDEKGNPLSPFIFSPLYDVRDLNKVVFIPSRNENGDVLRYQENIYSKDKDGNILRYSKSFIRENEDGSVEQVMKGDPIIAHKKGSIIGEFVRKDESFYPQRVILPKALNSENITPLYKRRNESGKEILIEKLTEGFRGKLLGNYKGMTITDEEIDKIEDAFLTHSRSFRAAIKTAFTRAKGDKEEVSLLEENIRKREEREKEINSFSSFHKMANDENVYER